MNEVYRLVGEIVRAMTAEGCPPSRAMRAEAALLSVVVNTMKPVREATEAAKLLPFGAKVAATALGVHRATVYRRASRRNSRAAIATPD